MVSPSATSATITTLPDKGLVFRIAPSDAFAGGRRSRNTQRARLEAHGARRYPSPVATTRTARDSSRFSPSPLLGGRLGGTVQRFSHLRPGSGQSRLRGAEDESRGNQTGSQSSVFPDDFTKLAPALLRTGKFDLRKTFISDALVTVNPKTDNIPAGVPSQGPPRASSRRLRRGSARLQGVRGAVRQVPGHPDNLGAFGPQTFDATMMCALASIAARSAEEAKCHRQER